MPNESQYPAGQPASASGVGPGPGYEVRDTNVRAVVTFLVGLTLFLIVAQVFLWGLLRAMSADYKTDAPAVQAAPDMIREQRRNLTALEDASQPSIGRAIDRIAEAGLPVTGAGKTEAEVNSHSGVAAPTTEAPPARKDQGPAKDAPKGKSGQGTAK